mgnify:FL=1
MDWIAFFDSRHIHYVTSGPNTARNQISTQCPFCGIDDPSQHMSISLEGKGFRCWRQPQHSGKNPAKLIQALLNCSWEQAQQLAGQERSLPSDFLGKIRTAFVKAETAEHKAKLKLPMEFKSFSDKPSCRPYREYLLSRNFTESDIAKTKDYGIYYASQGSYKGRIIFTIAMSGELVGWSGRTIYDSEQVRYKTLSHDKEKAEYRGDPIAALPISSCLLFYDRINAGKYDTLVLCEGPFDALRVSLLGEASGIKGTCFFTSTLSKEQLNLLHEILPRYRRKVLLLDQGTFSKATRIKQQLISLDVEMCKLPVNVKDPAEIVSTAQLQKILN